MSSKLRCDGGRVWGGLALACALGCGGVTARANVYPTNIKLNGSLTNIVAAPGDNIAISYILNEPAALGVTINILAGSTVVRTFTLPGNSPGSLRGLNNLVWDGKDASSNNVALGNYSVSITAATSGYTNWNQLTTDSQDGPDFTYVFNGRGIAVDRNTNSPYYGRVFVANAQAGFPTTTPGNIVGILKFNADASAADEGIIVDGADGHVWAGNGSSPSKIEVSADDSVYVDDLAVTGEVYRWDPTFSSNSLAPVLRPDNQAAGVHLNGPALAGSGTNQQLWMADDGDSLGIARWNLANGACLTNDTGTSIVGLGTNFIIGPSDVALDSAGHIYTCQYLDSPGDSNPRVFRFPAYDPSTNGGLSELIADWAVGANDDNYGGASAVAVDPTGTYVAVSCQGVIQGGLPVNGNTRVLYATNGALATNIDLGLTMDGSDQTEHQDTDCAWDAVGNLYYIDNWYGFWRAVSPPGTNQATTVAAMTVQVANPQPPLITGISISNGIVTLTFTSAASDTTTNFAIVSSSTVSGPYATVGTATITLVSPGVFTATFNTAGPIQFYRVRK